MHISIPHYLTPIRDCFGLRLRRHQPTLLVKLLKRRFDFCFSHLLSLLSLCQLPSCELQDPFADPRNRTQLLTIESPHVTVSGLAKLGCPFEYPVEHWCEVARRTGDDLEHLQRRRLLLPRLSKFAGGSCDLCIFA
jgi:hypothetical protein